ncbi:dipeptidase PepE [Winogradskyella bathintestinalis]|uniref:Dipeptidase PepE n=1 Tax=Winogradskyella bathintestinalis TaxID=3035208 RepID=A0ABT7ZVQ2_9FLAO|nr:dipeptidase PepE [Winogradskyella bathintestinalis]MDN3492909.1 dipeptidase PepE [Winogradskyella bathintestinalis]
MKSIIIASTSTIHGSGYLEYLLDELKVHFKTADEILFIPYARPGGISHDDYTKTAAKAFKAIGKKVKGIHEFKNTKSAIENAQGIFVGGGNTFVLVSQLYKNEALLPIKNAIKNGIPYLGTSAGSNICGLTMNTTNDMPIMYPPSFKTLGVVPFNINPHYLDPIKGSTHMGETRETRIKEFHAYNSQPVIGLREGSWIKVTGDSLTLKGTLDARIFEYNKPPYEVGTNSDLSFLK